LKPIFKTVTNSFIKETDFLKFVMSLKPIFKTVTKAETKTVIYLNICTLMRHSQKKYEYHANMPQGKMLLLGIELNLFPGKVPK